MEFDFARLTAKDKYKLMVSTVVPRPIALATTLDAAGQPNAAPFSFFNGVASDPPLLVLGIDVDFSNKLKDTGLNIRVTGEFVVNLVDEDLAQRMVACATDFPQGMNEIEAVGLTALPSVTVRPPRIAESPASFECVRLTSLDVGTGRSIVIGEIRYMHIRDEFVLDASKHYIATERMRLIGRMHGTGWYTRTGDLFQIPRISFEQWQNGADAPFRRTDGDAEAAE